MAIIGENGVTENDILVHDAFEPDSTLHMALINMKLPDLPVAFGVIRSVPSLVYDVEMKAQIKQVQKNRKITCVDELLKSGNTWEVTGNGTPTTNECSSVIRQVESFFLPENILNINYRHFIKILHGIY